MRRILSCQTAYLIIGSFVLLILRLLTESMYGQRIRKSVLHFIVGIILLAQTIVALRETKYA
ncbi:hypothetical protein MKX01_032088 [Papaver californicum]|nr:hypothetical protein MKX01_032088 [Papaver californicum]